MARRSRRPVDPPPGMTQVEPPPADASPLAWGPWYRAQVALLASVMGKRRAQAAVLAAAAQHLRRWPSPATLCAGCGALFLDGEALAEDDEGHRIHVRPSCRASADKAVQGDVRALLTAGIAPPLGGR